MAKTAPDPVPDSYFDALPVDQRQAMAQQRIAGYEADLFGHVLNLTALTALPDTDPGKAQAVADTQTAIDTIKGSIDAVRAFLATLG